MWDSFQEQSEHLSHDLPCQRCGHSMHVFLACDDDCDCTPARMPGQLVAH